MTRRVDLRSDTVTQPTQAMRDAMAAAVVGDDGYGEDPTIRALEDRFAALVGKEAAIFVPSGVMGNQIAVRILTEPGDLIVAGRNQHVVSFEMGAASRNSASNSPASTTPVEPSRCVTSWTSSTRKRTTSRTWRWSRSRTPTCPRAGPRST